MVIHFVQVVLINGFLDIKRVQSIEIEYQLKDYDQYHLLSKES